MIEGKFCINIDDFASSLANSNDTEQAKFFNIFFKALRINCESSYNFDMQLHSINRHISDRTKKSMELITFEDD